MSHTESNPAASAASVRSKMVANDIRSCGRNNPNQGVPSVMSPASRRDELVELGFEPVDVAARRVLVLLVELHDDCAARVDRRALDLADPAGAHPADRGPDVPA